MKVTINFLWFDDLPCVVQELLKTAIDDQKKPSFIYKQESLRMARSLGIIGGA